MNEELKPQLDNQFAGTLMQHSQYPAKIINMRKLRKNLPQVQVTRDYLHCTDCYQVWQTSTKRDIISSVVMSNTSGEKQAPPSYTENRVIMLVVVIIFYYYGCSSRMFCCLERNKEKAVPMQVIYLHQTEIWKSSFFLEVRWLEYSDKILHRNWAGTQVEVNLGKFSWRQVPTILSPSF